MIKIGYAPCSRTLTAPGDRRRFFAYAAARGLRFEIAEPGREYDLVVVATGGDITSWARTPGKRTKIVYDLIEPYLAGGSRRRVVPGVKDGLRGIGKYALGDLGHPVLSYRRAVEHLCLRADAVVCVTDEQRQTIERNCSNVHVILDVYDYAVREVKSSYAAGETLNLFWEGLPYTLSDFAYLGDVLRELGNERPVALHVMTDIRFGRYSQRLRTVQTRDLVDKLFSKAYLYEWNEFLLSRVASGCDLGVIPLNLSSPYASAKSENKLLLMWRMGLPTLTSATPACERAMRAARINMTCSTTEEWAQKLRVYAGDENARRFAGERGRSYAEREFSRERMLERWDAVLESVGLR